MDGVGPFSAPKRVANIKNQSLLEKQHGPIRAFPRKINPGEFFNVVIRVGGR